MTTWKYFFTTPQDRGEDSVIRKLGRKDEDGPRHNAEILSKDAQWVSSDFLERYHLLGTTDRDYVWITPQRAQEVIERMLSSGRLDHAPDEP